MPRYQVTDSESGTTMVLEGDSPPTNDELVELFKRNKPAAKAPGKAPSEVTEEKSPYDLSSDTKTEEQKKMEDIKIGIQAATSVANILNSTLNNPAAADASAAGREQSQAERAQREAVQKSKIIPRTGEMSTIYGGPPKQVASYAETMASLQEADTPLARFIAPRPSLSEPRVGYQIPVDSKDGFIWGATKELANTALSVPEFFTSDLGVLTVLTGRLAPSLVSAGFSADMIKATYDQLKSTVKNWDTLTGAQKGQAVVRTLASAMFAGATGVHAGKAAHKRYIQETTPEGKISQLIDDAVKEDFQPDAKPTYSLVQPENFNPVLTPPKDVVQVEPFDLFTVSESAKVTAPMTASVLQDQAKSNLPQLEKPIEFKQEPEKGAPDAIHEQGPVEEMLREPRVQRESGLPGVGTQDKEQEVTSGAQKAEEIAKGFQPAIRLMPDEPGQAGKLVGAERKPDGTWETHNEIIERLGIKPEDIDRRAFMDSKGEEMDRKEAAKSSGLPTEISPGELHSTDVNKAIEAAKTEEKKPTEFPKPVKLPKLEEGASEEEKGARWKAYTDEIDRFEKALVTWESEQPQNKPIIFHDQGRYLAITKDPQGGWRATSFSPISRDDARLMPWGHERFDTRLEAVKANRNYGELYTGEFPEVLSEPEIKEFNAKKRAEAEAEAKATAAKQPVVESIPEGGTGESEAAPKAQETTAEPLEKPETAGTGLPDLQNGSVTYVAPATGKSKPFIKWNGQWFKAKNGVTVGKPLDPNLSLTRALDDQLAKQKGSTSEKSVKAEEPKQSEQAAVTKIQDEVKSVAKTEGQRPAKEIKSELISKLEAALDRAPSEQSFTPEQQKAVQQARSTDIGDVGSFQYGKKGDEAKAKAIAKMRQKRIEDAKAAGAKQITISIPGDGDFTIWNTKEAIGNVLKAAKAINTKSVSSKAAQTPAGRLLAHEYLRRDISDAITVYGNESNAYKRLNSQLLRAEALELEPEQVKRLGKLVEALKKRIEAPVEKAQDRVDTLQFRLKEDLKGRKPEDPYLKKSKDALEEAEQTLAKERMKANALLGIEEAKPQVEPTKAEAPKPIEKKETPAVKEPPPVEFEHPAPETPEANALREQSDTGSKLEDEIREKLAKAKSEEDRAGYGTKRKEAAQLRREKFQNQLWSLQQKNAPIHEASRMMYLEHLVRTGQPAQRWAATVELLRQRAARFQKESESLREEGRSKEANIAYDKARSLGEQARKVSDEGYSLWTEAVSKQLESLGATPEEAKSEAGQIVNMQMSYPGMKSVEETPFRMRAIEGDRARKRIEDKAEALRKKYDVLADTGLDQRLRNALPDEKRANEILQEYETQYKARKEEERQKELAKNERARIDQQNEIAKAQALKASGKLQWTLRTLDKEPGIWKAVEGKNVKVPAAPNHEFFVYKSGTGTWSVVEKSTGLAVGHGKTQGEAVESASEKITNAGDKFEPLVAQKAKEAPPIPTLEETPPQKIRQGPGAATRPESAEVEKQEFQNETGLKNAIADMERVGYGFPEASETVKRDMGERWIEAGGVLADNPRRGDEILNELERNIQRGLSDLDSAILLRHKVTLENLLNQNAEDTIRLRGTPEGVEAQRLYQERAAELERLLDLVQARGTQVGREMRWRQALAREDYSFTTMERRIRAARGGAILNESEREQLLQQIKNLQELQKAAEERDAVSNQKLIEVEAQRELEQVEREELREQVRNQPKIAPDVLDFFQKFVQRMEKKSEQAKRELDALFEGPTTGGTMALQSGPLNPAIIDRLIIIGAAKLSRAALNAAEFAREMITELGDRVRPYFENEDIFNRANAAKQDELKAVDEGVRRTVEGRARRQARSQNIVEIARENIRNQIANNEQDRMYFQVQKMARSFVEQGVRGWRPLADAVHAELRKVDPNWDFRDTLSVLSGNGRFKPLSREEVDVELRKAKREASIVRNIIRIVSRQPVPKSGIEFPVPEESERRYRAVFNEMKKRFGLTVTDPATQLRSALQARKTYYDNRIADLNWEIQNRQRIVRDRTPPPSDQELQSKIEEYRRLKEERDNIFDTQITEEERLRRALRAAERSEQDWNTRLENAKKGIYDPIRKRSTPLSTPELETIRTRTDAIKEEVQELKDLDAQYQEKLQSDRIQADIAEYERKLAAGEFSKAPETAKASTPELDALKRKRDLARAAWQAAKDASPEMLANALRRAEDYGEELQRRINEGDLAIRQKKPLAPTTPEIEAQKAENAEMQKIISKLRAAQKPRKSKEEIALQAYKTRAARQLADLNDRIARKDFTKTKKRPLTLDPEAIAARAKVDEAKQTLRDMETEAKKKARYRFEKFGDVISKVSRAGILSSPMVIPKLISAGIQRLGSMSLEDLIGTAWGKVPKIRDIAALAPLEGGGFNRSAEKEAYKASFGKTMLSGESKPTSQVRRDIRDIWRTGKSALDLRYGRGKKHGYSGEREFGDRILEAPGRLHGIIKAPVKRVVFEKAYRVLQDFYEKQGENIHDPMMKERIGMEAYKAANRSIFLGDNLLASKVNQVLAEHINPRTGHPYFGSKVLSTTGRFLLPIVRVPTNIASETFTYAAGLPSAGVRVLSRSLRERMGKEVGKLHPEEADLIMRELKKGSIGGAMLLLGFLAADSIGGFYQPGEKRAPEDAKFGSIKMFGMNIPSLLLHNPLLEVLQVGATLRRVADKHFQKGEGPASAYSNGLLAAALGVTEEFPFVREQLEIEKLLNPHTRSKWIGEQAKRLVVPMAVSKTAEWMDPLNPFEERIPRKPSTIPEQIQSGIPILRNELPMDVNKIGK